jgi:putative restriction endonuclease
MYSSHSFEFNLDRTQIFSLHKPILLLAIIELFEHGLIHKNQIRLSPELIAAYLKYWNQLGSKSQKPELALTFSSMSSEDFWNLKPYPGFESLLSSQFELRTISAISNVVQYAYLDRSLFDLLRNKTSRFNLLTYIINEWFSKQTNKVEKLLNINAFREFQEELRRQGGLVYRSEILTNEEKCIVRDSAFRRLVSSIYQYQCAFCGLQVVTSLSQTLIDGVHIKPFSIFYDDRIDNGISLCKNHRWAFEHGWFTLDDNYKIVFANDLWGQSSTVESMREFQGQQILLPAHEQYCPRLEALRWHRENIFNKSTE